MRQSGRWMRQLSKAALLLSHRECTHGTYGFIFDCIHIFHWFVTSHLSKKRLSQFSTCNGFSSNPEILIKKSVVKKWSKVIYSAGLFNNGKEMMLSIYMAQVLVQKHSLLDQQMLSKIFLPQTWLLQWQNLLLVCSWFHYRALTYLTAWCKCPPRLWFQHSRPFLQSCKEKKAKKTLLTMQKVHKRSTKKQRSTQRSVQVFLKYIKTNLETEISLKIN